MKYKMHLNHILTLSILKFFFYYTPPHFYPVNQQHSSCKQNENNVDLDQLASLEASWSRSAVFKKQKRGNPGPAGQG